MLCPLVRPELLVLALVVFPVCIHEIEYICGAEGSEDIYDVGVGAARVTIRLECPITFVRPKHSMEMLA